MRAQPLAALILGFGTPVLAEPLINALVASGASKFATLIQSDPDVLSLYLSGQIRTVFAPSDLVSPPVSLAERDLSPEDLQQAQLQGSQGQTSLAEASQSIPGDIITTAAGSPGLGGQGQVVVTDTRPENVTHPTKRWGSLSVTRRQSNLTGPSLLRISSGLGNTANIINGDIPFDGGLIHITDNYFTRPQTLSSTAQSIGQTTFSNLASSSNLTKTLESTQFVTVFLPSNAAFAAANVGLSTASLISNHVVTGFVGYLPELKDGVVLRTQNDETLVISIRGGVYYVNGARIIQANIITENGVAHVIDQVLAPKSPPPISSSGVLSKTVSFMCVIGAVVGVVMVQL
ncbi:FAS1 domain-containing protein [Trichoderma ceciliae]